MEKMKDMWKIIIVIAVILIAFVVYNYAIKGTAELVCVPATCCHPTACISANEAPDCSDVLCTQECVSDTLDCQQGECIAVNGECQIKWKED